MYPVNNPLMLIYQEMQNGANAVTALDRVAAKYPQMFPQEKIAQARAVLGNNSRQYVENMARERGLTLEQVVRGMGVPYASNR